MVYAFFWQASVTIRVFSALLLHDECLNFNGKSLIKFPVCLQDEDHYPFNVVKTPSK